MANTDYSRVQQTNKSWSLKAWVLMSALLPIE